MNARPATLGFWPNATQELLLRAALLHGQPALSAWHQWLECVTSASDSAKPDSALDSLDIGSDRLLPLLYQNLRRENVTHPWMERFKGVYRFHWSKNQLLMNRAAPLLQALHQQQIDTLLLKGSALLAEHYRDPGLRPMGDFDFLVPTSRAGEALEIATRCGWRLKDPAMSFERLQRCSYAAFLVDASGLQIDIHWYLLPEGRQPDADVELWRHATQATVAGVATPCASPTDLLFHICAHGAAWNPTSPIRWVADAYRIVEGSSIDWQRLGEQAQRRSLRLPLFGTLGYLRDKLGAAVPSEFVQDMRTGPHPWFERIEYRMRMRPRGVMGALPEHLSNYFRLQRDAGPFAKALNLPQHFAQLWALESAWNLPGHLARKANERLAARFQQRPGA